jgi:hypothetical protein
MRKFGGEYSMSLEITTGIRAVAETWASAIKPNVVGLKEVR